MKITTEQLRRIISEEIRWVLNEDTAGDAAAAAAKQAADSKKKPQSAKIKSEPGRSATSTPIKGVDPAHMAAIEKVNWSGAPTDKDNVPTLEWWMKQRPKSISSGVWKSLRRKAWQWVMDED